MSRCEDSMSLCVYPMSRCEVSTRHCVCPMRRCEVTSSHCEASRSHRVCPTRHWVFSARRCVSSRRRWVCSKSRCLRFTCACNDALYDLRRLVNTVEAELRRKRAGRIPKRGLARQIGHHPRQARHGQSIGMKRNRADAEGLDSIAMIILVAKVSDHSLRTAGQSGGRKGACASMVNDRHHSGKEKVMRNAGNRKTRPPTRGRACRWRGRKQGAYPSAFRRGDDQLLKPLRISGLHTAEADVDRFRPRVQEVLQVSRETSVAPPPPEACRRHGAGIRRYWSEDRVHGCEDPARRSEIGVERRDRRKAATLALAKQRSSEKGQQSILCAPHQAVHPARRPPEWNPERRLIERSEVARTEDRVAIRYSMGLGHGRGCEL